MFSWPLKNSSVVDVLSEKSEMVFLLIQSCFKHSVVFPVGKVMSRWSLWTGLKNTVHWPPVVTKSFWLVFSFRSYLVSHLAIWIGFWSSGSLIWLVSIRLWTKYLVYFIYLFLFVSVIILYLTSRYFRQTVWGQEEINLACQLEVRTIASFQNILILLFLATRIFVSLPCLQRMFHPLWITLNKFFNTSVLKIYCLWNIIYWSTTEVILLSRVINIKCFILSDW